MTHPRIDEMIRQHILEHEARLKHIDELMKQAHEKAHHPEAQAQLSELAGKREVLADQVAELKRRPRESWHESELEKAGPMGLWDIVAQQLEHLVERLGG